MTINECEKVLSSIKNDKLNIRHKSTGYGIVEIAEWLISELKAADQPLKHGKWIRTDKSMGVETAYACSECGYLVRESDRTNYCGDCGADMRGDIE